MIPGGRDLSCYGLNGFLNFIPLPPPGGIAGQFMGALYVSHYLWVIFAFQVVAAVLLLVNRYLRLAVVLAPVIVQYSFFSCPDGPERTSIGPICPCAIGVDLRQRSTGLCRLIPIALGKTSLIGPV